MNDAQSSNTGNTQRQLAIFEVTKRAAGKSAAQIKALLAEAFAERGLTSQPGPWLDAVASEASYGKPYILDIPSAVAADKITAAPDTHTHEFLRKRRVLRGFHDSSKDLTWPRSRHIADRRSQQDHESTLV